MVVGIIKLTLCPKDHTRKNQLYDVDLFLLLKGRIKDSKFLRVHIIHGNYDIFSFQFIIPHFDLL